MTQYLKNIFSSKLAFHLLLWMLIFSFPFLVRPENIPFRENGNFILDIRFVLNNIFLIALFYLNIFVLYPKIFKNKGTNLYVVSLVVSVVLITILSKLILDIFIFGSHKPPMDIDGNPHNPPPNMIFFLSIFIIVVSICYKLIEEKIQENQRKDEKENINLKTELSFLRSQINPHFIFNVLNNAVSLARKKSPLLESTLIKLSNTMHYMLYRSDEEKVTIEREIEYIGDYLDLQMQRLVNAAKIRRNFEIISDESLYIEPMLMIPFIENAFKHGASANEVPEININIKVHNKVFYLNVVNKFNPSKEIIKDKSGGIGLVNVKRRLDLLYPGSYILKIEPMNNWYFVTLIINL